MDKRIISNKEKQKKILLKTKIETEEKLQKLSQELSELEIDINKYSALHAEIDSENYMFLIYFTKRNLSVGSTVYPESFDYVNDELMEPKYLEVSTCRLNEHMGFGGSQRIYNAYILKIDKSGSYLDKKGRLSCEINPVIIGKITTGNECNMDQETYDRMLEITIAINYPGVLAQLFDIASIDAREKHCWNVLELLLKWEPNDIKGGFGSSSFNGVKQKWKMISKVIFRILTNKSTTKIWFDKNDNKINIPKLLIEADVFCDFMDIKNGKYTHSAGFIYMWITSELYKYMGMNEFIYEPEEHDDSTWFGHVKPAAVFQDIELLNKLNMSIPSEALVDIMKYCEWYMYINSKSFKIRDVRYIGGKHYYIYCFYCFKEEVKKFLSPQDACDIMDGLKYEYDSHLRNCEYLLPLLVEGRFDFIKFFKLMINKKQLLQVAKFLNDNKKSFDKDYYDKILNEISDHVLDKYPFDYAEFCNQKGMERFIGKRHYKNNISWLAKQTKNRSITNTQYVIKHFDYLIPNLQVLFLSNNDDWKFPGIDDGAVRKKFAGLVSSLKNAIGLSEVIRIYGRKFSEEIAEGVEKMIEQKQRRIK